MEELIRALNYVGVGAILGMACEAVFHPFEWLLERAATAITAWTENRARR